jgi:serine/threonine protein kinase/Tol biopolymer transport system component
MSMIGRTLGNFELTSQLGKGGMGEVYKAKDHKLGRDVAIKVLPEEFARDTERVARFQREAKLLASLNHPNIAAIHGLEEFEGTHFLVLELIEGETLAERIKSGPVPVEDALKLGMQIAEALEAAHEKGVIHRDLKSANIKVTPDGKVKVLDFGLAKAYAGDPENMNLSNSPTLSDMATQQGVILGTAAYMPPEQAKGKSVDKRADIWAFGVVLFEMLSGRQLFSGESVSETLAAVIKSEPEWNSLPPNLHPRIRLMLERCLEKEPKNRYGAVNDARVDIERVLANPGGVLVTPVTTEVAQKKLRTILPWIAAIIIIGIAVWILKPTPPPEPNQVMVSEYVLPEDQQLFQDNNRNTHLAISSNGSQMAYSTTKGIYIRPMDELNARLITGSDKDAGSLFFSPDGQWIGYFSFSDQKLKKISVNGGTPMRLCDASWVYGAVWYEDNMIVYSDLLGGGVYRVSSNGGDPDLLVSGMTVMPQLLPDGKSVMFMDVASQPFKTVVQSLESEERTVVLESGAGFYLPTGHLVYLAGNNGFAVPFDLDKLKTVGEPVPLNSSYSNSPSGFAFSDSGTFVAVLGIDDTGTNAISPKHTFVWVDRDGNEEPLGAEPDNYTGGRISPDGTKVAMTIDANDNEDIYVWDIARKTPRRLTFNEADDGSPLWTPDSQKIVFTSRRVENTPGGIYWKNADGTGVDEELLTLPDRLITPYSWSIDGKILVLWEIALSPLQTDIGMMSMEGNRERKGLLQEKYSEGFPQISPDGRFIAYSANEFGKEDIFVRAFPDVDSGGRWPVSNNGGNSPLWSPNGNEIYYRNGNATMVVPVETEPTFNLLGNPEILFEGTYFSGNFLNQITGTRWDIHPTNGKFLMLKPLAPTGDESTAGDLARREAPRKIIVVTNMFEDLKERVPVD